MIEVRRLRLLVELSRRGTIAAVAQARHVSPSGVSHQLSLLEREVGAELLQRAGRGVRLTEAGRRLALRGSQILVALETARTEARSPEDQPSGTCRVAAFGSAVRALLPAVLGCQDAYPGLRIELAESEPEVAVPGLLSGDFDIVVSEEYPGEALPATDEIHRRILLRDPLEIVVRESLLDGRDLPHVGGELPWALEPVGADCVAWRDGRGSTTQADVLAEAASSSAVRPGGRLLTDVDPCSRAGLSTLLAPLVRDGSAVWVRHADPEGWDARAAQEQATDVLRG